MENAVLMAKLEMISDFITSFCESSGIGSEVQDPQEMLDVATVLGDIATDAAMASVNFMRALDAKCEYVERKPEAEALTA